MTRYDAVVIGAGLGGLTAAAILAREGRKVVVIERGNSVGGAASSYKVGDLFVEGSLHATTDPHDPRDPKHAALTRAGVLDAVQWIPSGSLYEVRGGPLDRAFVLPDNLDAARQALITRFAEARAGIEQLFAEIEVVGAALAEFARDRDTAIRPRDRYAALRGRPELRDRRLSLAQKLDRLFGGNEAVKCAIAANLAYYHDDPASLGWLSFAAAQGSFLRSGARYIQGGSQRLSSALARAIMRAGGEVILRRTVSAVATDATGAVSGVTHTARDGSDPQTLEATHVIGNAAPTALAEMMPADAAVRLADSYAARRPSISLFALTLGLSHPPRDFGVSAYSTQLLPDWMRRLSDYAQGTRLMADEPAGRMPPLAIVDYAAIDSGVPAPPYVLSVVGPDDVANWDAVDAAAYRAKRARWQSAIVAHLDAHYPGLAAAVTHSSFNTALSVQQYLNAPHGAVYGFAPDSPRQGPSRSPHTVVRGLYLASAYAGFGGYSGVVQAAATCADLVLRDGAPG